jgi:hypothetical protein
MLQIAVKNITDCDWGGNSGRPTPTGAQKWPADDV